MRVEGNTIIPRTIFGRFYILCAILRQFHLCISLLRQQKDTCDVLFVDQLSACIPFLKLFCTSKVSNLSATYSPFASYGIKDLMSYYSPQDLFLLPLSGQKTSPSRHFDTTHLSRPSRSLRGIYHRFVLQQSQLHHLT